MADVRPTLSINNRQSAIINKSSMTNHKIFNSAPLAECAMDAITLSGCPMLR
jgi:hypothetical protein